MTPLFSSLLVGLALAASPAPSHSGPNQPPPSHAGPGARAGDDVEEAEAFLVDCEAFGWSGAVHIQRGKKTLLSRGFGTADDESGRACTPETLFEIASITKPIAATAVLALVEARKVDLDASITEYLPSVPDHAKGITVRHLLLHTSGMPRSGPSGHGDDLEAAVAKYLSEPPSADPGENFEYWNGGYALLAAIIEQQSGKSFEEYVRSRIFKKAGMKTAGFTGDKIPESSQARGVQSGSQARWATEHPYGSYGWQYKGMGGVVAHVEDLARFLQAFAGGKLVGRALVADATQPKTGRRGLGWEVNWDFPSDSYRLEHGGSVRGFQGYVHHALGSKLSVVVLSNRGDCPTGQIALNVSRLAVGELSKNDQPRLPPSTVQWKKGQLKELVGDWKSESGETLGLESTGPRSLAANCSLSLSKGGDRIAIGSPTAFATVSKFGLETHVWSHKPARNSELVWNGLKGSKARLTLTGPEGKATTFTRD